MHNYNEDTNGNIGRRAKIKNYLLNVSGEPSNINGMFNI